MSNYCSTIDVNYLSQIAFQQLGMATQSELNNWLAGTLIPIAQVFVNKYCNHNFGSNTGTIICDGNGKESLHIPPSCLLNGAPAELLPLPLISVSQVSIDGTVGTITDFKIYKTFLAYECGIFCDGRQNVEIVAVYGYNVVPEDIKYVTAQLCANALTEMVRKRMLPDLITPILEGGGDVGILFRSPKVLTENEKAILWQYIFHHIEVA